MTFNNQFCTVLEKLARGIHQTNFPGYLSHYLIMTAYIILPLIDLYYPLMVTYKKEQNTNK